MDRRLEQQLGTRQTHRLEREGERIKAALKHFVQGLPQHATSMGGLSKWAQVSRSTAQRLLQSTKASHDGIDVICHLPSPQGISQVIESMESLGFDQARIDSLTKARDILNNALWSTELTHNQLKNYFKSAQQEADDEPLDIASQQKALFEINSGLIQESIDTSIGIDCISVNPEDDHYLSEVVIAHRSGIQLGSEARPFTQPFIGNTNNYKLRKPTAISTHALPQSVPPTYQFLLKDLSSNNIEDCFSGNGIFGNSQIYDVSQLGLSSVDISLGHFDATSEENPLKKPYDLNIHGIECRSPTRKLVFISLLHEPLAARTIARTGAYTSSQTTQESRFSPEESWNDRFVTQVTLHSFMPADDDLERRLQVPNVNKLIDTALHMNKIKKEESIGYYICVDYPIWLSTYRIYFEFGQ